MATPSTPHSPPDDSRDDDEISLEEVDQRAQQRPRLPDHRREKKQFEMGAPAVPGREYDEPIPSPSPAVPAENVVAAPDEIETYDPAAMSQEWAGRREKNEPAAPVKVTLQPTAGLDDLEEFIARTATEGPQEEKKKERRPFTLVEKVCFGSGMLVLLALAVWLVRAVASQANGVSDPSRPRPKLPMEGSLITIKEAAANWRYRTDKDRVAEMEVILPKPQHQTPDIIPQTTFTVDTAAGKSGFLRFIFRDSSGKPRGDTRVVHVEGGSLKDMGKGEIIKTGSDGSVYCSEGMQNLHAFHSYEADEVPRWHVEVAESADYGAGDKDWKVLGTFDVRNDLEK